MDGRRFARALLALVVVAASASLLGIGPSPAAGTEAASSSGATTGAAAIDTTSRSDVADAYLNRLVPALAVPAGWTGSVDSCNAGAPSAAAQAATFTAVNYYRSMAGLAPVAEDVALSAQAQQAALLVKANGQINHAPPTSWRCWSSAGAAASGTSNLGIGNYGAQAVATQMEEPGAANGVVGHRRWILNPARTVMGAGSTDTSQALWVSTAPGRTQPHPGTPTWTSWPTAGYFPDQIEPDGRWSLTVRGADFTNAVVTVTTGGGTALPLTVTARSNQTSGSDVDGYGDTTLAWDLAQAPTVEGDGTDRSYHVVVSGIGDQNGATAPNPARSYAYDVILFTAGTAEPAGSGFVDVSPSYPFAEDITWMAAEGISTGYEPGPTYRSATPVSRSAMAAFMYRLAGSPAFTDPTASTFGDVATTHDFFTEIEWMAAEGISTGTPTSGKPLYKPGAAVSRSAMAAFMYRLAGSPAFTDPTASTFGDVSTTHDFFTEIEWMASEQITTGTAASPKPLYKPATAVSRGAMSAFMHRLADGPGAGV